MYRYHIHAERIENRHRTLESTKAANLLTGQLLEMHWLFDEVCLGANNDPVSGIFDAMLSPADIFIKQPQKCGKPACTLNLYFPKEKAGYVLLPTNRSSLQCITFPCLVRSTLNLAKKDSVLLTYTIL